MPLRGFSLPQGDTEGSTGYEPEESVKAKPKERVIVHSDQGSQYGSDDWLRFDKAHKLDPSMSRRGNRWDSDIMRSLNRSSAASKRRGSEERSTAHALSREQTSSTVWKCSTIQPDATATLAALVPRHSRIPQNKPSDCLRKRGKSTDRTHLGLEKYAPEERPIEPREMGEVGALLRVGGLHRR